VNVAGFTSASASTSRGRSHQPRRRLEASFIACLNFTSP
jgi:hypothetical protein